MSGEITYAAEVMSTELADEAAIYLLEKVNEIKKTERLRYSGACIQCSGCIYCMYTDS